MKLNEILLLEAFNSKVNSDVIVHTASRYQLESMIGGRKIKILFNKIMSEADSWDFEFYEQSRSGKWTTAKTGSGHELRVFAFVGSALRDFIDVYNPEKVEFNAFEEDGSERGRIYEKLIKRMNLDYSLEIGKSHSTGQTTFTLKRKD